MDFIPQVGNLPAGGLKYTGKEREKYAAMFVFDKFKDTWEKLQAYNVK